MIDNQCVKSHFPVAFYLHFKMHPMQNLFFFNEYEYVPDLILEEGKRHSGNGLLSPPKWCT